MGRFIDNVKNSTILLRRIILILALGANLGILFYFKYYNFFVSNLNSLTGIDISLKHIVLPIGISFFTFQGMSYILDIYMGKVQVQKKLLNVALYISLFPQLVAGPIVRYSDINKQIDERSVNVHKFAEGVKRFIIGLGKKVIIANSFAAVADRAFSTPSGDLSVAFAWIGAIAYAIQIYFDFSGYSDMAIGLGKMLGFDFLENFNYPYISKTVTEFWRRWHISLSSWFRDYVYIPLGGNRTGNVYVNLFTVFFLTGLWHGASWNFVIWGLWHGVFLIVERLGKNRGINLKLPVGIKWLYTMLIVVIGWVLFRASNFDAAVSYIGSMLGMHENMMVDNLSRLVIEENWLLFLCAVLASFSIISKLKKTLTHTLIIKFGYIITPILYIGLFILSISYTVTSTYNPFIYFNF